MAHDSGRGLDAAGREECLLFKSGNGDTPRGLFQESQHTGPLLVHDLRRYTEYSSEWVRASRRGVFVAGTPAEHWYSLSTKNQDIIWQYLQVLCRLAEKATDKV